MQIVFIHQSKAFLPELDAYTRYFNQQGIKTAVNSSSRQHLKTDVEWYFMGTYPNRNTVTTIHEYASASVPPMASLKDLVKRKINATPDFRIFNNEYVRHGLDSGILYQEVYAISELTRTCSVCIFNKRI